MAEEFPSNSRTTSRKAPEERAKVEKVIAGEVVRRKKPLGRRVLETFFGSEDARGVGQYLLQDVIVPMTKDLIADVVTKGIETAVYGESRGRGLSPRGSSRSPHVPYNRYSQSSSRADDRRDISARGRARHDFDELEYDDKFEAQEVLDRMLDQIERYGTTTIADFYEASGVTSSHVDASHGWTDLSGADVLRIRGGKYIIKFPPTTEIR